MVNKNTIRLVRKVTGGGRGGGGGGERRRGGGGGELTPDGRRVLLTAHTQARKFQLLCFGLNNSECVSLSLERGDENLTLYNFSPFCLVSIEFTFRLQNVSYIIDS